MITIGLFPLKDVVDRLSNDFVPVDMKQIFITAIHHEISPFRILYIDHW